MRFYSYQTSNSETTLLMSPNLQCSPSYNLMGIADFHRLSCSMNYRTNNRLRRKNSGYSRSSSSTSCTSQFMTEKGGDQRMMNIENTVELLHQSIEKCPIDKISEKGSLVLASCLRLSRALRLLCLNVDTGMKLDDYDDDHGLHSSVVHPSSTASSASSYNTLSECSSTTSCFRKLSSSTSSSSSHSPIPFEIIDTVLNRFENLAHHLQDYIQHEAKMESMIEIEVQKRIQKILGIVGKTVGRKEYTEIDRRMSALSIATTLSSSSSSRQVPTTSFDSLVGSPYYINPTPLPPQQQNNNSRRSSLSGFFKFKKWKHHQSSRNSSKQPPKDMNEMLNFEESSILSFLYAQEESTKKIDKGCQTDFKEEKHEEMIEMLSKHIQEQESQIKEAKVLLTQALNAKEEAEETAYMGYQIIEMLDKKLETQMEENTEMREQIIKTLLQEKDEYKTYHRKTSKGHETRVVKARTTRTSIILYEKPDR